MSAQPVIRLVEASKWYGEVLGLNRVSLDIASGITALVGPNGSGKSTLMGLVTGLLRPSKGRIEVLGIPSSEPQELHRILGFCPQHDAFPAGFTGDDFLLGLLATRGLPARRVREMADIALERVGLTAARKRRIGAYSKGMRQRLKLALAIAHEPRVLVLDEPLDGLDPLGRAETMALFRELATGGATLLLSSHVLHEVDSTSDAVVMLHHGYVVAEGQIRDVRSEIRDRPLQVTVWCREPARLAAHAFSAGVQSARVGESSVLVETFDTDGFARLVARLAAREEVNVEGVEVIDETVQAVYDYLIGGGPGDAT